MLRPLLAIAFIALMVPLTTPGDAQSVVAGAKDLVIVDGTGDLAGPLSEEPGPFAHADIDRFIIGRETSDSFEVRFDFAARPEPGTTVAEALALTDLSCTVDWRYDGRNDHVYGLNVYADDLLAPGGDPGRTSGYLYQSIESEDTYSWNYYEADEDFTVAWDATEIALVATIPKSLAVHPDGHLPADGVTLEANYVRCRTSVGGTGFISDRVESDGQLFRFQGTGPGEVVSVRFGDHTQPEVRIESEFGSIRRPMEGDVALAAGEVNVVPLTLENRHDAKRIVTLAARALDAEGKALPWNVSLAPSVALHAEESRLVKLIVVPPADAAPGLTVSLEVSLAVLGEDAPGQALAAADIVPILGPGTDTYRFFTQTGTSFPLDPVVVGFSRDFPDVTMSLLPTLPGWGQDPVQAAALLHGMGYSTQLDGLARDARLDPEGDIVLTLEFSAESPGDISLYFGFQVADHDVFWLSQNVPTGEPVEIRRAVGEILEFPAGSPVSFYMYVEPDYPQAPLNPKFHPASSSLKLPLLPPPEQELDVTDGRFLPTLSLAPGEDRESYINPGGIYTFEMVVANEGVETDDLRISVTDQDANATGWVFDIKPGRAFRVPAGNATHFGVQVTAPVDAAENERVELLVEAVSKHDPQARAKYRLALVATSHPFEDKLYEEGEDQIPALPEKARESPSGVLSIAFMVVGLSLVALRRRMT